MRINDDGNYEIDYHEFHALLGEGVWYLNKGLDKERWDADRHLQYIEGWVKDNHHLQVRFFIDGTVPRVDKIDVLITPKVHTDESSTHSKHIQFIKF